MDLLVFLKIHPKNIYFNIIMFTKIFFFPFLSLLIIFKVKILDIYKNSNSQLSF
jgi:hypothetical protein